MKINTPVGKISFEGELTPETIIIFLKDNSKITLARWATLTNGACFEWLEALAEKELELPIIDTVSGKASGPSAIIEWIED